MQKTGVLFFIVIMILAGPTLGDKLLSIESRQIVEDEPHPSDCGRCFTTGRAKEQLLNLRRDRPYGLPKAALPADVVDTITILAIRVNFTYEDPDDPLTTGRGVFDLRDTATFLAEEGHALDPAPHNQHYFQAHLRSMDKFWNTASDGKLRLVYEVWPRESDSAYNLGKDMSHYGAQPPAFGLGELFHDALNVAHETEGDSLVFRDEGGKRKAVLIFHAGADRQTDLWFSATPTPNDLFTGFLTFDGNNRWFMDPDTTILGNDTVITGRDTIREGVIMPETMTQDNRVTCMNAVMAHEFGHQLGLIDLYNTGSVPFLTQMGDFALMDNMGMNTAAYIGEYGVGAFGTVPVFPMAWSRAYLGFDEVHEYREGTSIELAAVKMQNAGIKIAKIPISSTEYYLLENRRSDVDGPVGLRQDSTSNVILWPARYDPDGDSIVALPEYDLYLPLGSAGIAIWHIDELAAAMDYFPFDGFDNNFDANTLQWDPNRRFVRLLEADGLIDFGGIYHRGFGTPRDLYYAGNNSSFTSYTNPPAISNDGGYTHIRVTDISVPGMIMTFNLNQDKMADGFPRRLAIPADPRMSALAADLDGDGDDEILTVSGRRILAMTADGASFIDPSGNFDTLPGNIDTIFSTIQSATDANSGRPVDTSLAIMPVFADIGNNFTSRPVVATFNDTGSVTLVMAGDAGGLLYSYLPYDSPAGPNDGRAELFKLRATVSAGAVKAVIPDVDNSAIHVVHAGGQLISASWDAQGPISDILYDFGNDFVGLCHLNSGYAFLLEAGDLSVLYLTPDLIPGMPSTSVVLDSVVVGEIGFYPPVATDFNRDSEDEIVLLSATGHVLVYSARQNMLVPYQPLYDLQTGDTAAAGPAVGDISGNGYPELIVPGTNRLYGFDRHGNVATDFPLPVDYSRPGQLVITPPIISDFTGDNFPDLAVTVFDSTLRANSIDAYYYYFPDSINYPDSVIRVDTVIDYNYFNYYSTVHVVSPGIRRVEGFPLPARTFGIRQPGESIIGAGSALHLKYNDGGLLVTTGADGWLAAWDSPWSDDAAIWPMAARTADASGYLPLDALGEEVVMSEFLPESKFYNYPNPASGSETRIRFYLNQPASVTVTILDALGDQVWETKREVTDGNSETEIPWDISEVASGIYHCRLEAVASAGSESKVAFKTIAVVK